MTAASVEVPSRGLGEERGAPLLPVARRASASSLAAAAWQPQRSPIPIRPSQVRERRGPLAPQAGASLDESCRDEEQAAEEALGTTSFGAAATVASRVVPPQLDVALWMLDECETPKRSHSITLDASKRLGFGETPSKKMPALTPPVHMHMDAVQWQPTESAPLEVAIAPTPCTGVSSPTAVDSWQLRATSASDRTSAQSPVVFKLERQLFATEASQSTVACFHSMEKQEEQVAVQAEKVDAAKPKSITRLSPNRRLQCRGLGRGTLPLAQ